MLNDENAGYTVCEKILLSASGQDGSEDVIKKVFKHRVHCIQLTPVQWWTELNTEVNGRLHRKRRIY